MANIVAGVIVAAIAGLAAYSTFRKRKKGGCGCGCDGCDKSDQCS